MIAVGTAVAMLLAQRLNLLCLGDELAGSLGVRVKTVRFTAIATASLLCAAAVSFAGLLGFVGLIVPHMARRMAGNDMRVLIPFCCLCGGSLVVLSDLAARTLFMPAELPAGILMAALGRAVFPLASAEKGANAVIICNGISLYRGKNRYCPIRV